MAKKTPESKEDAAARRQRDLALLTSGVAAFSLMGETPAPAAAPAAAPAEAPVAAPAAAAVATPAPKPVQQAKESKAPTPPAVVPTPVQAAATAPAAAKRGGEKPAPSAKSPKATAASQREPDAQEPEQEEADELEASEVETATATEPGELDLARLFVPSNEKKGTTLRITADHQQFFTNMGFLLGNGASAPDLIHNILTRFRADHEAQIQKAMKKQLRLMMSPKK